MRSLLAAISAFANSVRPSSAFDQNLLTNPGYATYAAAAKLADFEIVLTMRERTPLPASLINRLPKLRMLGITGTRNIFWRTRSCMDSLQRSGRR